MAHIFKKFLNLLGIAPQEKFLLYNVEEDDYLDNKEYFFTDNQLFFIDEKGLMRLADDKIILDILRDKYLFDCIKFHPKVGEKYWTFVDATMEPLDTIWDGSFSDYKNKKLDIVYRTYEQAMRDRVNAYERITGKMFESR